MFSYMWHDSFITAKFGIQNDHRSNYQAVLNESCHTYDVPVSRLDSFMTSYVSHDSFMTRMCDSSMMSYRLHTTTMRHVTHTLSTTISHVTHINNYASWHIYHEPFYRYAVPVSRLSSTPTNRVTHMLSTTISHVTHINNYVSWHTYSESCHRYIVPVSRLHSTTGPLPRKFAITWTSGFTTKVLHIQSMSVCTCAWVAYMLVHMYVHIPICIHTYIRTYIYVVYTSTHAQHTHTRAITSDFLRPRVGCCCPNIATPCNCHSRWSWR